MLYSNHTGHATVSGRPLPPVELEEMVEACEKNNFLSGVRALLTGYLPTQEHVKFASFLFQRIQKLSPDVVFVCDPILGDMPKGLYVSEETAQSIRTDLVPLAHVITPNFFEFSWLTGETSSRHDDMIKAARLLACSSVVITSVPCGERKLSTLLVEKNSAQLVMQEKLPSVPHGTGDVLSGLLTGYLAMEKREDNILGKVIGVLDAVLKSSVGFSDLQLLPTLHRHEMLEPFPIETLL